MTILSFNIDGKPVAQKQTRFARGRAYDPSEKDKKRLQAHFRQCMEGREPLKGPVSVTMIFSFAPPLSFSLKKKRELLDEKTHTKKPDIDNLAYLVTNALKGIVIDDDSQINWMQLTKRYDHEDKIFLMVHEYT
jgi:Holliday junction resolvase RusA-like endonuclease